jgi:hypothetical protein
MNLKYPKLEYIKDYREENKKLFEKFGSSSLFRVPTTSEILPYNEELNIKLSGSLHSYNFKIPVNFDDEKYKQVYESLKEDSIRLKSALMPYHHPAINLLPEKFKPEFGKLDLLSKEQLMEIIRNKVDFKEDTNMYFNNNFNVTYVKSESFVSNNFIRNKCDKYKITNLYTVFDNNLQELIDLNSQKIQQVIDKNKIKYINKLIVYPYQLTRELIVYELYIVGKFA